MADTAPIKKRLFLKNILLITVGSAVYGAALGLFLDPNALAPGGVSGLAVLLSRVLGLRTGTWFMLMNIPILILGIWRFGFRFILSTIYSTVLISLCTNLSGRLGVMTRDPFLAALAGGVLMAVGIGLVFKAGSTTGGTDIIVKCLRQRMPHLRTGRLFLILDVAVVALSALVFRDVDKALYAGVAVAVNSFVLDLVLYGRDEAKLIYIISDHAGEIAERLLKELDIGVTYMQGKGAYSGRPKQVILCAVKKHMAPKAEDVVREEDPLAFLIVTSATEIYGEGYKSYFGERL